MNKIKECSECGSTVHVRKSNGLCPNCHTDSLAPTREQIDEECRKIREEGFNKMPTGLGKPEGEFRQPRVYRTPRF